MADVNEFKEIFLLGSFHVVLPTFDVFTDLALITKLYREHHPNWATLLLVPFLVNYTLCWIARETEEVHLDRRVPWLLPSARCCQVHPTLLERAIEGVEGEEAP